MSDPEYLAGAAPEAGLARADVASRAEFMDFARTNGYYASASSRAWNALGSAYLEKRRIIEAVNDGRIPLPAEELCPVNFEDGHLLDPVLRGERVLVKNSLLPTVQWFARRSDTGLPVPIKGESYELFANFTSEILELDEPLPTVLGPVYEIEPIPSAAEFLLDEKSSYLDVVSIGGVVVRACSAKKIKQFAEDVTGQPVRGGSLGRIIKRIAERTHGTYLPSYAEDADVSQLVAKGVIILDTKLRHKPPRKNRIIEVGVTPHVLVSAVGRMIPDETRGNRIETYGVGPYTLQTLTRYINAIARAK